MWSESKSKRTFSGIHPNKFQKLLAEHEKKHGQKTEPKTSPDTLAAFDYNPLQEDYMQPFLNSEPLGECNTLGRLADESDIESSLDDQDFCSNEKANDVYKKRQEAQMNFWANLIPKLVESYVFFMANAVSTFSCVCIQEKTECQVFDISRVTIVSVYLKDCACSTSNETLLRLGIFQCYKKDILFTVELVNRYRDFLNRAALSVEAFLEVIRTGYERNSCRTRIEFNWKDVYRHFSEAIGVIRHVQSLVDKQLYPEVFRNTCLCCPQPVSKGTILSSQPTLYIAADGNFRLFRFKGVSRNLIESRGCDFFKTLDKDTLAKNEMNLNNCSNFRAVSNSTKTTMFDETGVFLLTCARHEVPLMACDMYTGERFSYCDFLLTQLLKAYGYSCKIVLYYDVACSYKVNFFVINR